MPFWKKPEDPWDIDPSKKRKAEEREPRENPLDTARAWNEKRKADAAARAAELDALPREKCPWCGKEMERGYILAGKGCHWYPGIYTSRAALLGPPREAWRRRLRVDSEGALMTYQTAWHCESCRKLVMDTSSMETEDGYSVQDASPDLPEEPGETP